MRWCQWVTARVCVCVRLSVLSVASSYVMFVLSFSSCLASTSQHNTNTRDTDRTRHSVPFRTHRRVCCVCVSSRLAEPHWQGVPHKLSTAEAHAGAACVRAEYLCPLDYRGGAQRPFCQKCSRNNRQTQTDPTKTDRYIQTDSVRHGQTHTHTHTDIDRHGHRPIANTHTHTHTHTHKRRYGHRASETTPRVFEPL